MMTEKQKSWGMFGLSLSIVVIVVVMACMSGCTLIELEEEKLKGLVDAKIEGVVGFNPLYKAKLADTLRAGDDVLGDLVKDNLSLQMKISTQADTIKKLENIGRDKWDFSGGAVWVVIALGIALLLSFLTNLGQRSFIKALAMAIYTRKEVSGQETKTMANKVKTQTRKGGIINRLGGWIGDKIIKRNNINALAK